MDTYHQYNPLNEAALEICLVKLLPGDGSVRIAVQTFPLVKAPPFVALSYHWGYNDMVLIQCEGASMSVAPSLGAFLEVLKRSSNTNYLWVDIISVNQENMVEKAQTIALMPQIYRAAARTLIWTGSEDHGLLNRFINSTSLIGDFSRVAADMLTTTDVFRSNRKITHQDLRNFHELTGGTLWDTCDRQWGVNTFLERPYFMRLWILPDIICSRNPILFDEKESIPWGQLASALLIWLFFNPTSSSRPSVLFVICRQAMRRSFHGLGDTRLSVPDVLLSLRSFPRKAVDERDNVYMSYSVVGAIDSISNHFKADYSMSSDDVFRHAAFGVNDVSGQPLSLSLTDSARSEIPSWTPDWTSQSMRFLLNHATSTFSASPYAVYQVDYRHQTDEHRQTQLSDANTTFSGLVVDVVKHRSSFLPPRRHCDHYVVNGANSYFLSEWHEFAREHSPATRSDYLVSLAFADTIQARGCGHVWEDAGKVPQDRVQEVTEFLDFLEDEDSAAHETDLIRVFYAACFPSHDRRFAVTKNGRFCLVPEAAKRGDLVSIPHGSRVPYILRPEKEKDLYHNIGEAFVHGLMHREAGEMEVQDIRTFSLH